MSARSERARILAELVARLELERFTPTPRQQAQAQGTWTTEEQAHHRESLLASLAVDSDDALALEYDANGGNVAALWSGGMVKRSTPQRRPRRHAS